ncbi:MAG: PQQ-dependent sugar dehydrogenase [Bryobacteraceae bacterium]
MRRLYSTARVMISILGLAMIGKAGTPPSGFTDVLVAGGLASPTAMAIAPDGRVLVCEQAGRLRVIKNGVLLPAPFLSVTVDSEAERGLLGVAADPDYATNRYLYVYYTRPGAVLRNVVSRFTANGDVALPGSETPLLELDPLNPGSSTHNGGALHFGADGKLYVAVGENAEPNNSLVFTNLLGKILRMNPDGSVPPDNPFVAYADLTGNSRLIWAYGLRNPFTFAVQPGTGALFINDVGQDAWEEINVGRPGANYGWPLTEGPNDNPLFDKPLFAYPHRADAELHGCAIAGGAFYDSAVRAFPPEYRDKYFFADLCGGWISTLDPATGAVARFLSGAAGPVDLRAGPEGGLYYLQRGADDVSGELRRIDYTAVLSPSITTHPASRTVPAGVAVTFTVAATGSSLAYQWQRGGVNIPNANQPSYTLAGATVADSAAAFQVVVSNTAGSVTSNAAILTVVNGQPPVPTISSPAAGVLFSAGETITFSGSANDPETGPLPPQNLTWTVNYLTGLNNPAGPVVRPFLGPVTGAGGSFTIPVRTPYTLSDVAYRITLTSRDPQGLETTVRRDLPPRVSTLTVATSPPRLGVTLDGQPTYGPVRSVVGLQRDLGAPSPQVGLNARNSFLSWLHGGPQSQTITVPPADAVYVAKFATQYKLSRSVLPVGSGSLTAVPSSGDDYYDEGTSVLVQATPIPGWSFSGFSGDLFGSLNPVHVQMSAAKSAVATFSRISSTSYRFVPVTPCRTVDTRVGQGALGAFGPPALSAGAIRMVPIPAGPCGIPSSAKAYSLNVTVVPRGFLSYLTIWPVGQPQPVVSTLNSFQGEVVANAAIVPGGSSGAVNVFVTDATDVIMDINGFFAAPGSPGELQFYPVPPCRLADTRADSQKTGPFGAPSLSGGLARSFPVLAGGCGIPSSARAYALNATVVPPGPLDYLTLWPSGSSQPLVSTLNSFSGAIVANAAIVPAGQGGAVNVFASQATDVILDINGYFAPPGPGGLNFTPVAPCRVADTRRGSGFTGAFGEPPLNPGANRVLTASASNCGIPPTARALAFNVTVVPAASLSFLTAWPTGLALPQVSTLNSFRGFVVANAAIIPTGTGGAVSFYATDQTDLIVDVSGYFE